MSENRAITLRSALSTPLVAAVACFIAGIIFVERVEPGVGVSYLFAGATLLACIWWERDSTMWLFAFAAGGLLYSLQAGADRAAPFVESIAQAPASAVVEGVVVSPPASGKGSRPHSRFHLELEEVVLDGEKVHANGARVFVDLLGSPPLEYGDRVRLIGTLRKPRRTRNPHEFDFARFLELQGIHAELLCADRGFEKLGSGEGNQLVALGLRSRAWISRQITRGIGQDDQEAATLILAMTLGLRDDTPDYIEDKFRYSGTLHVFAVSGLHVGIVAAVVWFAALVLTPIIGLPRNAAVIAVIFAVLGYALVTGLRPSACRAAIMGAIFFGGMLIGREPHVINSTAAAALVILLPDTNQLFRPGFQLSFLVLLSIAILANTVGRYLSQPFFPDPFLPISLVPQRRRNFFAGARKVSSLTGVSAAAWAGSTPLTWIYFGLVTPISIVANLILIPLAFLVLGTAAFSVALSLVPHPLPAELANEANALWAKSAATSAGAFSNVPGGHWIVPSPGHLFRSECEITILDLPYGGAATHIALRGGGDWLIDAGSDRSFRRSVHPLLRAFGTGRLDGLILTHGDIDHVGGAPTAISEYAPKQLITTPANSTSPSWRQAIALAGDVGIEIVRPAVGEVIDLGRGHTLRILYPPAEDAPGFVADDRSLVTQLRLANGCRILFTGDSGFYTERWLIENCDREQLRSDVLIKSRHDSDISGLPGFVAAVAPQALVISGAPRSSPGRLPRGWIQNLDDLGITLFDQSKTGAVRIQADANGATISGFLDGSPLRIER